MSLIRNAVMGLAFNDQGQVLLTQRFQPEIPEIHLKWQLPGGGQDFGEHPEDTLKREILEEIGVRCEVLDERPLVHINIWYPADPKELQINLFTYLIDIGQQKPEITDVETNDYQWVEVDKVQQLPQLPNLTQMVRQGYELYLKRKVDGNNR